MELAQCTSSLKGDGHFVFTKLNTELNNGLYEQVSFLCYNIFIIVSVIITIPQCIIQCAMLSETHRRLKKHRLITDCLTTINQSRTFLV